MLLAPKLATPGIVLTMLLVTGMTGTGQSGAFWDRSISRDQLNRSLADPTSAVSGCLRRVPSRRAGEVSSISKLARVRHSKARPRPARSSTNATRRSSPISWRSPLARTWTFRTATRPITTSSLSHRSGRSTWDATRLARSRSVRFDQPGIVRVFCDIHSHMSAFILVFGHRFFAVTDEEGHYRIEGVPPGTYNVVVWHELFESASQPIEIPENGNDVELNFSLQGR